MAPTVEASSPAAPQSARGPTGRAVPGVQSLPLAGRAVLGGKGPAAIRAQLSDRGGVRLHGEEWHGLLGDETSDQLAQRRRLRWPRLQDAEWNAAVPGCLSPELKTTTASPLTSATSSPMPRREGDQVHIAAPIPTRESRGRRLCRCGFGAERDADRSEFLGVSAALSSDEEGYYSGRGPTTVAGAREAAASLLEAVDTVGKGDVKEGGEAEEKSTAKVEAKVFEASLRSFQELVNTENVPTPLAEALERLRPLAAGDNFVWETGRSGSYGGVLSIVFQLVIWYTHREQADARTRISTTASFLARQGCAYIYQPVLPVTSLAISPRPVYMPMFDLDPRTFHLFKLSWRRYLNITNNDYRIVVGEQLDRWTLRMKNLIEKPMNATYWLMLMAASYYREALVRREVLRPIKEPFDHIEAICIDNFVTLSAIIFAPERQILFAGLDPTPSYLRWLQYIADQNKSRKRTSQRGVRDTVFESNGFLDLSVIVVFYGRVQQKTRETNPQLWVGNPDLVKSYTARFAEDNKCANQLEHACRLYSYSCSVGLLRSSATSGSVGSTGRPPTSEEGVGEDSPWFCWNGLKVCEIGVPMPATQASFLSPFCNLKPIALLCKLHGPDAPKPSTKEGPGSPNRSHASFRQSKESPGIPFAQALSRGTIGGTVRNSTFGIPESSEHSSERDNHSESNSSGDEDDAWETGSARSALTTMTTATRLTVKSNKARGRSESVMSAVNQFGGIAKPASEVKDPKIRCTCQRYIKNMEDGRRNQKKDRRGNKLATKEMEEDASRLHQKELEQALQGMGEYDTMHSFAALLAGALNLSKTIVRLHFAIDSKVFSHLPPPGKFTWADSMLPWYREHHRADAHGRSRYGLLLEAVLRGLMGDGWTSGLNDCVLDCLRGGQEAKEEIEKNSESMAISKKVPEGPLAAGMKGVASGGILARASLGRRGSTASALGGHTASEHKPAVEYSKKAGGVISNILLWIDLYGSDSLCSMRLHFETFSQWCHSAHLIPFLQRCYRRCGVAGLLTTQQAGCHRHGMDPEHPLVVPTMTDFCYGHCYPLHKVLRYFYGGMEQIVCSLEDPRLVESDKASLELHPGQDKLNNQCWFRVNESDVLASDSTGHRDASRKASQYNAQLMKKMSQLQGSLAMPAGRLGSTLGGHLGRLPHRQSEFGGNASRWQKEPSSPTSPRSKFEEDKKRGTITGSTTPRGRKSRLMSRSGSPSQGRRKPRPVRLKLRQGALALDDPFFWFCSQNLALHTYPVANVPRHVLNDAKALGFYYSDFVSRTATPEPARGVTISTVAQGRRGEGDQRNGGAPVPPSICVCQPTEISSHVRSRWDVKMEFVDEEKLILGDAGWFPGALGHRFTYEAKTNSIKRYVHLKRVPEARLLYLEHTDPEGGRGERQKVPRGPLHWKDAVDQAGWDDEGDEEDDEGGVSTVRESNATKQARRRERAANREYNRRKALEDEELDAIVDVMLPAVLTLHPFEGEALRALQS